MRSTLSRSSAPLSEKGVAAMMKTPFALSSSKPISEPFQAWRHPAGPRNKSKMRRNNFQAGRNNFQAGRNKIQGGRNKIKTIFLPQIELFQSVAPIPSRNPL